MIDLYGSDFLTLKDFSTEEINYLLDLATFLKKNKKEGKTFDLLKGKNIVLLFEKTSTRTRCAFEVAAYDEGANVTFLTNSQMGKKESLEDTIKVLSLFYDGIEFRGREHKTVEEIARYSEIPVFNGLTDSYHPTQVLADLLTIKEHFGSLKDKKLVFVGDARNNMGNSLMVGAAKMGIDFVALAPEELYPEQQLVEEMRQIAEQNGSEIILSSDFKDLKNADAVYTDIWVSMGEEDKIRERVDLLQRYQVNSELMKKTDREDTIFLHCLPSFHDQNTTFARSVMERFGIPEMEVTDEVFRSKNSLVFKEAENRMHTIKAVLCATLSKNLNEVF